MILYLIKSIACSAIFLAIYYLWLEREKMHTFNRFFLLFSLCFAIIIPFWKIDIMPQASPAIPFDEIVFQQNTTLYTNTASAETNFLPLLGLMVYSLVVLILSCRFTRNLLRIRSSVINNKTISYNKAELVLLNEKVLPHSFLGWIFLYKEDYHQIEKQLLTHELTHVKQKHSIDILIIEILQIILWFNPLLYLYKKAIKINHEFLADESVIKHYQNVKAYQHILLKNLSQNNHSSLASYSNFALTKKRLIMMTKSKSPTRVILKKVTLIPVFVVIAIAFSTKILAQETTVNKEATNNKETEIDAEKDSIARVKENFYKNSSGTFGFKNEEGKYVYKKYEELTPEQKERLAPPPLPVKKLPTQEQLNAWLDPNIYGVWLNGRRIDNSTLKEYNPSDFGDYTVSQLMKNAKNYGKHKFQVNISTQEYFEAFRQRMLKRLGIGEE